MIKVNENSFDQPDVSQVTPVEVPQNATRSGDYELVYVNDYGKYERAEAYWDDIDKAWRYSSSGIRVKGEVVRHDGEK